METVENLVRELVAYPSETEWLEFKVNFADPRAIGEYISALSNAASSVGRTRGFLVWGVDDESHEIVGTDFDYRRNVNGEPLEHWLARQLVPSCAFRFSECDIEGQRVVVLAVPAAKTVPTSFAAERYCRISSSKENLRKYPEREAQLFATLRDGLPSVANTPAENQDLTFERLFTYYAGKGIQLRLDTFKTTLGLCLSDGRFNLLAQLLSDNDHIPVRVSVFDGPTKTAPLYSVREFGNTCVLLSLEKALEYGQVLNVPRADERNRTVERKEVSLFSEEAFREAIVNAFVHNRWVSMEGPAITVFSDRIEILSRGALAPEQTLDGFYRGESVPVNRPLSDIFLQLHISERSGRGVPKIVEECGRSVIDLRENSLVVTIPFRDLEGLSGAHAQTASGDDSHTEVHEKCAKVCESVRKKERECAKGLSGSDAAVYAFIEEHGTVSNADVVGYTGLSINGARKVLQRLMDAGLVIRQGQGRSTQYCLRTL